MDEAERELRRHDPSGRGPDAAATDDGAADDGAADDAVASALRTASGWVGDTVSVVGVGELPDGAPCVVVHTSDPAGLPSDVEGVPVVVVVVAEAPRAQTTGTPEDDAIATLPVDGDG